MPSLLHFLELSTCTSSTFSCANTSSELQYNHLIVQCSKLPMINFPQATQRLLSATGLGIEFRVFSLWRLWFQLHPLVPSSPQALALALHSYKSILHIAHSFPSRNPEKISAASLGTGFTNSIYGALGPLHAHITFFLNISPLHCYTFIQWSPCCPYFSVKKPKKKSLSYRVWAHVPTI